MTTGEAQKLLHLINHHRAVLGLHTLVLNPKLTKAAGLRAAEIWRQGFLSHARWVRALRRVGYYRISRVVGENLAKGQVDIDAAFQAWLDSPEHRANIEKRAYREMGYAHLGSVRVNTFGARA